MDDVTQHLFNYLRDCNCIFDLKSKMSDGLRVKSHEVQQMIRDGDPGWEKYVPMVVAKTIKEKGLFGYKAD